MEKKIYTAEIKNFLGIEYLVGKNVPVYDSKFGQVIDLDPAFMEKAAAEAIIKSGAHLRGKEVKLIRSALDLSLEKFAGKLDLSAATVMKWERASETRLALTNEVAVKLFAAELLNVAIPSTAWTDLIKEMRSAIVTVDVQRAA